MDLPLFGKMKEFPLTAAFFATMVMAVFPELYAILALLVVILIGGTIPVA